VALLVAGSSACGGRIVAPLRYEPPPPAPEEPHRQHPPQLSTVVAPPTLPPWSVTTLPNGLRIAVLEKHSLPVVSARITFDRGAADVSAPYDTTGILAEMLGGGTSDRTAEEVAAAWARIGAGRAIDVGDDGASVGTKVPAGDFDTALGLLAGTVMQAGTSARDFPEARAKWLRAFRNTRDAAEFAFRRNAAALLFGRQHGYGFGLLDEAHTQSLAPSNVAALRGQILRPEHATLVVVGDASTASVVASATRWLGGWMGEPALPRPAFAEDPDAGPRVVLIENRGYTHARAAVLVRMPALSEEDAAAVDVLLRTLGSVSSALYREVREEQGAAYAFGASMTRYRGATVASVGGQLEPSQAVPTLLRIVNAIRRARAVPVSAEQLESARGGLLGAFRSAMSSTSGIAALASSTLVRGRPLETLGAYPARVATVTAADVQRVAGQYFGDDALRAIILGTTSGLGDLRALGIGWVQRRDGCANPAP
jgi:zinc protease